MAKKIKDNPENYTALARMFSWVDKSGSAVKLMFALSFFCVIVLLANLTFSNKGHFLAENITGFYALFGFLSFTFIVLAAKLLRVFIKRPENYYGDKAVDGEEFPEDELDRKEFGDV